MALFDDIARMRAALEKMAAQSEQQTALLQVLTEFSQIVVLSIQNIDRNIQKLDDFLIPPPPGEVTGIVVEPTGPPTSH